MGKKLKITLLILGIILVTGLGAGYIVYDKATDYVIANVFESLLREDLAAEGMLGEDGELTEQAKEQMAKTNTNTVQEAASQTEPTAEDVNNESVTEGNTASQDQTQDPAASSQDQTQTLTTTDKKPAAGKTNTTETQVSIEERVKEIVKSIPVKDKNAVMRLIMQNVSSNDIRYLSGLVTDGNVSGSDIAKAKEIAYKSFTPEQMKQVKYYYTKYIGLFSEFY